MKTDGTWPDFDPKYTIASFGGFFLNLVLFGAALVLRPGFMQEIAILGPIAAIMFGYGSVDLLRDFQKAITALGKAQTPGA